jgi:hypothetical protein
LHSTKWSNGKKEEEEERRKEEEEEKEEKGLKPLSSKEKLNTGFSGK